MPIPKNKEELILSINQSYEKLKKELKSIPIEEVHTMSMEGHAKNTIMSPANLVAYLIGWGELVLKWANQKENGTTVIFPERGYKWTELGLLAQKFYRDYENLNYEELLKRLDFTTEQILSIIDVSSNEKLYKSLWYKTYSMGRMIQLNTSSPFKNARIRLRKWKKNQKN